MRDAACIRLDSVLDARGWTSSQGRIAKYLEYISEQMDDSTEDMKRCVRLLFFSEIRKKKKDESAFSGFGTINDCNYFGSELKFLV